MPNDVTTFSRLPVLLNPGIVLLCLITIDIFFDLEKIRGHPSAHLWQNHFNLL